VDSIVVVDTAHPTTMMIESRPLFAFCGFVGTPAKRGTRTIKSASVLFESLGYEWFLELHPGGGKMVHFTDELMPSMTDSIYL